MNRRDAIRQAGLLAGAATLWASLPARTWAALSAPEGGSAEDEALLTLIGDTIIPTTASSPGAGAIGIGRFILTMAPACYSAESVAALTRGLGEIQAESERLHARKFQELTVAQREAVLIDYEKRSAAMNGPAPNSFRLIKELTLLGYFTSESGATQALRYLPIPGGYRGSVPLAKGERSWAL